MLVFSTLLKLNNHFFGNIKWLPKTSDDFMPALRYFCHKIHVSRTFRKRLLTASKLRFMLLIFS
jgi:hypothetical protein